MKASILTATLLLAAFSAPSHAIVRFSVVHDCDPATEVEGMGICVSESTTATNYAESFIIGEIGLGSEHFSPSGYISHYPFEWLPVPWAESVAIVQFHIVFNFPGLHYIEGFHQASYFGGFYPWTDWTLGIKFSN